MRKIVTCLFVSVDGVIGEPAEWLTMSDDLATAVADRAMSTDTILLGRVTYEQFAIELPSRSGPVADFINATRKVVVSTELEEVHWQNAALLDGDALIGEALATLRRAPGKDLLVLGSATLVQSLLRRAMIDELVLLIHPVIKGQGRRLFDELSDHAPLQDAKCVTFGGGVVSLSYAMSSRPPDSPDQQPARPHMRTPEETAMHIIPDPAIRELDHRSGDGIDVKLLWNSLTNRVSVAVEDQRSGEFFELDAPPEDAQIAFQHPYAYAHRGWFDHPLAA